MTAFINLRSTALLACLGIGSTLIAFAPASAAEVVIQMLGAGTTADPYRYEPATVEVKSGDTVKWSNKFGSNTKHTATPKKGFEALLKPTGDVVQDAESAPQTITAGPIEYFCDHHPTAMQGTINVTR